MIDAITNYLLHVLVVSTQVITLLLLPTLIAGGLIQVLTATLRNKASLIFGRGLFIYSTFLGTITHELGHAFFCKVFLHKITDIKLFAPEGNG